MKNVMSYIDKCSIVYNGKDTKYILIKGWGAIRNIEPVFSVRDGNNKVIGASIETDRRIDVEETLVTDKGLLHNVLGFDIKIDISNEQYEKIVLFISDKQFYSTTMKKLEKEYEASMIKIYADDWKKRDETSYIKGWCFHKYLPFKLTVYNGAKKVDADIVMSRRVDIERIFDIVNDSKVGFGFYIEIDNSQLDSDDIRLVVEAGDKSKEETIDLGTKASDRITTSILSQGISLGKIRKGVSYLRKYGMTAFVDRLTGKDDAQGAEYQRWFLANRVSEAMLAEQNKKEFEHSPTISIAIPLFNTKIPYLKAMLDSVVGQSYVNWELCLADGSTNDDVEKCVKDNYQDDRIKYKRLKENYGIAGNTNAALGMATGDFVMLCDHDDLLELDALYEIVKYYNNNPDTDIIYTDEDLTDDSGKRFRNPRFKPDYNLDLLRGVNYICHIFVVRKSIMDQVGGFKKEYDGAQDWDMILRCCELSKHIGHIPRILYHWRAYEESTAGNIDSKQYAIEAGRKAVSDHCERMGLDAELIYTDVFILFRVKLKPKKKHKISIIIPNKDETDTLKTCIESIEKKSTYDNYEIIIVENNSTTDEIFEYYKELEDKYSNTKVVYYKGDFNYSAINNFGAKHAEGDFYILLNNDTEVITEDWMECMLGYCEREDTGIVGAKLYYPDDVVQHCGIVVGVGGFAGHIQTMATPQDVGYMGWLKIQHNLSAVTAACLMIKKSVFDEVGGLSEDFVVALNDVDLCLKVRETGKLVTIDPGVELYHYESKSRGLEVSPEKHERFKGEIKRFRDRWSKIIKEGDPYYNPHLTLMLGDCSLRKQDEKFDIIEEIESEN